MRTVWKKIMAILLSGMLAFCAACSSLPGAYGGLLNPGKTESTVENADLGDAHTDDARIDDIVPGVWAVNGFIEDGQQVTDPSDLAECLSNYGITMTLYEDGILQMSSNDNVMSGTWKLGDDSTVILTNEFGSETVELKDGKLYANFEEDLQGIFIRIGDAPTSSDETGTTEPENSDPGNITLDFVGTWKSTGIILDGKTLSGSELEYHLAEYDYEMYLYADNTMRMIYDGGISEITGTWAQNEISEIELYADNGSSETLMISGSSLIADFKDGMQGVFTRIGDVPAKEAISSQSTGDTTRDEDFVGNWVSTGVIPPDGEEISADDMQMGNVEFRIYSDHTFLYAEEYDGQKYTAEGTWYADGLDISMEAEGDELYGYLENGTLFMHAEEALICFEKKN